MQLDPFYRVTFTTPESWSVTREGTDGVEGQSFLIAEGRAEGGLSARYRAANFPRRRVDGAIEPAFRGVLETDDGAAILFRWDGLTRRTTAGKQHLLGSMFHTSDDDRYRWLNDRVCAVEGEVRPRAEGGSEVILDVSLMSATSEGSDGSMPVSGASVDGPPLA
ncbi:MAG TPA: DUF3237 family protein [Actinomycetota bacterium]|jgi:hypothetical protein|nr:DUF3237 family protein [Actinomycetota bacterium]